MVNLNDPVQRKDFLVTQMKLAEEKMKQSEHYTASDEGTMRSPAHLLGVKRPLRAYCFVLHLQTSSQRQSVT